MRIYIPAKTIKELRALAHLVAAEADASQYSSAVNVCGKDGRGGLGCAEFGLWPRGPQRAVGNRCRFLDELSRTSRVQSSVQESV